MTEKIPSPDGNGFSRRESDVYVADVLIKNNEPSLPFSWQYLLPKGGQMYRLEALPFRLREFHSHPKAIVAGSPII